MMGFFNFGKKKSASQTTVVNAEKLENGELPFGWYAKHKDYLKPKEQQMISLAANLPPIKEKQLRMDGLKRLIETFYSFKSECESKGECFIKYFEDMWMHCHNSKNSDFVYIAPYEDELEKLKSQ